MGTGLFVQRLGRAWRPGRKPRLVWDAQLRIWSYDPMSIVRISGVCSYRERNFYAKLRNKINLMNVRLF